MTCRRQRGLTLIEILITLALLIVGLAGLFAALTSSVRGSAVANHFTQAQARAHVVIENMMGAPRSVLDCLAQTPASGWSTCEASCAATLGASSAAQACTFTTLSTIGIDKDTNGQQYAIVYDNAIGGTRSSAVTTGGLSGRVYDLLVTIGWNDNGQATPPTHRVTLHAAVFE
jgi:type II secretory pathway pseudopilin PulG